ncbi:MAG: hypothetical protein IPQ16_12065 [Geobacteraceae bacterium]|nr:hypothetical protein [Geobacteraceae bacterium]
MAYKYIIYAMRYSYIGDDPKYFTENVIKSLFNKNIGVSALIKAYYNTNYRSIRLAIIDIVLNRPQQIDNDLTNADNIKADTKLNEIIEVFYRDEKDCAAKIIDKFIHMLITEVMEDFFWKFNDIDSKDYYDADVYDTYLSEFKKQGYGRKYDPNTTIEFEGAESRFDK